MTPLNFPVRRDAAGLPVVTVKFSADELGDEVAAKLISRRTMAPEWACWEWLGAIDGKGYGQVCTPVGLRLVHRVAYVLEYGEIPDGLTIDHLCRNTRCINPNHLEPVTQAENNRRKLAATKVDFPRRSVPWTPPVRSRPLQTHCKRGHELVEGNLVYRRDRGRMARRCAACDRDHGRQRRLREASQ